MADSLCKSVTDLMESYKTVTFEGEFKLKSGNSLPRITLAYETYGTLNEDGSNVIFIFHALTGDSHVASHGELDSEGWWESAVGPGKAYDTNKYFVILYIFLVCSCSSTLDKRKTSQSVYIEVMNKNYQNALEIINNNDFYSADTSKLLKYLELGTINYLNNNYYQALKNFEKAKKISDDLYTISISKKALSAWDANLDIYYGEVYEASLIRFYISLINYNLYQQGFYEAYFDENGIYIEDVRDAYIEYYVDKNNTGDSYLSSYKDSMKYKQCTDLWLVYAKATNDEKLEKEIKDRLTKDYYVDVLKDIQEYIDILSDEDSDEYYEYFEEKESNLESIS